jgi:hypothetical protein
LKDERRGREKTDTIRKAVCSKLFLFVGIKKAKVWKNSIQPGIKSRKKGRV